MSKTRDERIRLSVELLKKLNDKEFFSEIQEFSQILKLYTQDDIQSGFSGKIKIKSLNRILHYNLPIKIKSTPSVHLRRT